MRAAAKKLRQHSAKQQSKSVLHSSTNTRQDPRSTDRKSITPDRYPQQYPVSTPRSASLWCMWAREKEEEGDVTPPQGSPVSLDLFKHVQRCCCCWCMLYISCLSPVFLRSFSRDLLPFAEGYCVRIQTRQVRFTLAAATRPSPTQQQLRNHVITASSLHTSGCVAFLKTAYIRT